MSIYGVNCEQDCEKDALDKITERFKDGSRTVPKIRHPSISRTMELTACGRCGLRPLGDLLHMCEHICSGGFCDVKSWHKPPPGGAKDAMGSATLKDDSRTIPQPSIF